MVKISWKSLCLCVEGLFQEWQLKIDFNKEEGACREFQRKRTLQEKPKHRVTDERGMITGMAKGKFGAVDLDVSEDRKTNTFR